MNIAEIIAHIPIKIIDVLLIRSFWLCIIFLRNVTWLILYIKREWIELHEVEKESLCPWYWHLGLYQWLENRGLRLGVQEGGGIILPLVAIFNAEHDKSQVIPNELLQMFRFEHEPNNTKGPFYMSYLWKEVEFRIIRAMLWETKNNHENTT